MKLRSFETTLSSDVNSMRIGGGGVWSVQTPTKKSQCDICTDNATELKSEIRRLLNHRVLLEKAGESVRQ